MILVSNLALLETVEADRLGLPNPYVISDETKLMLDEIKLHISFLKDQRDTMPHSMQRHSIATEIIECKEREKFLGQMVTHYSNEGVS